MALDLGELVGSLRMETAGFNASVAGAQTKVSVAAAQIKKDTEDLGTTETVTVDVDQTAMDQLVASLPKNAKDAVDRSSIAFKGLSPALQKAVTQAEQKAQFDKLPANMLQAVQQAEAVLKAATFDDVEVDVDVDVDSLDKAKLQIAQFRESAKSDLMEVGGSVAGLMTKAGMAGPAIMAVGAALSAAAAGVVGVTAAVGPAAAAGLAAYAGGLLAIKVGSAAVAFAMDGVADAAAGDEEAYKKLTPAGKALADSLKDLKPEFKDVRKEVENGLFPGLDTAITMLAGDYLPMLKSAAGDTGTVLGGLAVDAATVADSPAFKASFGQIVDGNTKTLGFMGGAAIHLASAAVTLFASAQPLINAFFKWAEGAAGTIDKTVQAANESGKLADFWDKAANRGETLWGIISNLGGALGNVFQIGAADSAGGKMLKTVEGITQEFESWTESASGVKAISGWFEQGKTNLAAMWDLLSAVSGGLVDIGSGQQLAPLIDQVTNEVIPPLMDFLGNASASGALESLVSAVGDIIGVFASLSESDSSLKTFADTLGLIATAAGWVVDNVPGASDALAVFFTALGVAGALKFVGLGSIVSYFGTIASAAITSALTTSGAWTATAATGAAANTSMAVTAGKFIGYWVAMGVGAVINAGKAAGAWLLTTAGSAVTGLASMATASGKFIAHWVLMGVQSVIQAGKTAAAWALTTGASAAGAVAATASAVASTLASWALMGAQAVVQAAKVAGAWLLTTGSAAAGSVATMATAAASVVAGWVLMGAQALAQAARVAAAWLIAMGPIGLVIAAVVGVGVLIYKNWDKIKEWTRAAWDWVVDKVKAVPGLLVSAFMNFTLPGLIIKHWDDIKGAAGAAWDWVVGVVKAVPGKLVDAFLNFTLPGLIIKHWDDIKAGASAAWDAVVEFVKGVPGKLVDLFLNFTLPGLVIKHFDTLKEGAIEKAQALVAWVAGLPGRLLDKLAGLGGDLSAKGKDSFTKLKDGAVEKANDLVNWVTGLPARIIGAIGAVGGLLKEKGTSVLQGLKDGITDKWSDVSSWIGNIPSKLLSAVGNLGSVLKNAGLSIIQGLLDGITEKFEAVKDKVKSITDWIAANKGPKSRDLEMWRGPGNWIMTGLMNGLDDQVPALQRQVRGISDALAEQDFKLWEASMAASASMAAPPAAAVASAPAAAPPAFTKSGWDDRAPRQAGDVTNNWNISGADDPYATGREVSRQQALAGAGA